jgi:peptide deformylase
MSLLQILKVPHPILKQRAIDIDAVDGKIQQLMQDMLETMYKKQGIGLAANQVGVLKRVMVIDIKDLNDEERPEGFFPLFIANPQYLDRSQEQVEFDEGCLSVPNEIIRVKRPKAIKLKYLDFHNQECHLESNGWLARVIQHEIDHLDGITIVEYVSKLKRDLIIKKINKQFA